MHCTHEPLRKRVEAVLEMAISTVGSLAGSYVSGDADVGKMFLDGGDEGGKSAVEDVPMDVVKHEQPDGSAQELGRDRDQEMGGEEGDGHGAESEEEGSEEEDDDSMLEVIG